MKKSLFATGLAIAMALPLGAQAADYVIDTKGAHASINFKVSHLGYSFIKGRFNTFSGDFSFDEKKHCWLKSKRSSRHHKPRLKPR